MESEPIEFETADGVRLAGDLRVPQHARGAAIVCHPHPQYGGNRFNPVVDALYSALPAAGIAALRFDFRCEFGNGVGELLDAETAQVELVRRVPDVPVFAAGYSFGAMIALGLDRRVLDGHVPDGHVLGDRSIAAKVLIAPPLGHIDIEPGTAVPTLVLSPAHDQFAPPDVAAPIVASWPLGEFATIDSVDHFMVGRAAFAATLAVDWIQQYLAERDRPERD